MFIIFSPKILVYMYIFSIAKFVKNSIVFHIFTKIAQGRKTGLDLKIRYAIGKLEVLGLKLYLIRHGETDWNKEFKIQGSSDIELNEYGRELAFITREGLRHIPFDIAYTSPLKRAKETAEIILGGRIFRYMKINGSKKRVLDRLRVQH